ncbi:hypothetical protein B0O99DRAFT_680617 [Bisporella sp. PMI_857]|nr:hypothetical protein B0O99DRAFT_680617 [Bisporella sp. PMI_857]
MSCNELLLPTLRVCIVGAGVTGLYIAMILKFSTSPALHMGSLSLRTVLAADLYASFQSIQNLGEFASDENITAGADQLVGQVYSPLKKLFDQDFSLGWQVLIELEELSATKVFRSNGADWGTIQWLDTMTVATNTLDQGVIDNLLDDYFSSVPEIVPGHDDR